MKGVTLVEMLVVITIFSLVVGAVFQLFLTTLSFQRKILKEQEVLDELGYAIEYMGRALRMAKKDDVIINKISRSCLSGDKVNYYVTSSESEIQFRSAPDQCQRFYLSQGSIYEKNGLPLTSPKIKINSLKFKIKGETQNDTFQPMVTVIIEAQTREEDPIKVTVQTTISQRDLDVVLER